MSTTSPANARRLAGLDMLRGVAVGLVVIRHMLESAGHETVANGAGIVGVTVFFTLSGYLITGVLDRDLTRFNGVRYARFYRNRALRLLPALVVMLIVYVAVEMVTNRTGHASSAPLAAVTGLFYVADVPQLYVHMGPIAHLWTLAVEEQFYLVWPIVLYFAFRRRATPQVVLGLLIATSVITAVIYLALPSKTGSLYTLPTTWAPALIAGATTYHYRETLAARFTKFGIAHVIAIVVLAVLVFALGYVAPLTYLVGAVVVGTSTALLIVWLSTIDGVPTPWLRPLHYLGTISYGVYLWNLPIAQWISYGNKTWAAGLLGAVVTIAVAALSWVSVEKMARQWRDRLDSRTQTRTSPPS